MATTQHKCGIFRIRYESLLSNVVLMGTSLNLESHVNLHQLWSGNCNISNVTQLK